MLKELALSREQLKRDLAAARQELELVAGAADAAKEEAAVQINMLQRQLGVTQDKLAVADKVSILYALRGVEVAVACGEAKEWPQYTCTQ